MDKVEDDLLDAVNQRNVRSPDIIFRAHDGQLYRPLLARQTIYGSGARKFAVIFVRTLPRKFVGDETTSALLIGLILASRFRFTFVESERELLQETLGDGVTDADFQLACRQLSFDVERMEQESSEFGMNSPDLLLEAFGSGNHEIVNSFYEIWFPARNALLGVLKERITEPGKISRDIVRRAVKTFTGVVSPYNRRFLKMCLEKYTVYLEEWLRRTADRESFDKPASDTEA
jgi:hypothetical protein